MSCPESPTPIEGFIARFLARVPPDVAASFSPTQLAAVQRAFGMRYAMQHAVDVRRTLYLPWGRYYVVLLGGKDRRNEGRRDSFRALLRLMVDTFACGAVLGGLAASAFGIARVLAVIAA
jgi:hypothetical protein